MDTTGFKTTEYITVWAISLVIIMAASGGISGMACLGIGLVGMGYQIARGLKKFGGGQG